MRRLLALLAALALLGSACSTFGTAPAATVGGTKISARSLQDEIAFIRSNPEYMSRLEQTYGAPAEGSGVGGTFDAAFVAQLLSLRVWYQAIERDLGRRGVLPIPADVLDDAETEMEGQFRAAFGPGAFDAFPADYRTRLIEQRALIMLVERDITESIGDDPEAFFAANRDEFAEICLSHILVGVQGGRRPAEAAALARSLRDRIEAGEDFFDIAREESEDPGSAAGGGALGCGSRSQLQFDPDFEAAAFAQEVDVVSEPVETRFGAHLILVTERRIPRYAEVEQEVPFVMRETRDLRINEYLVRVICEQDVDVNPRYGSWTDERCDAPAPQLPRVAPPAGPGASGREGVG